MAIAEFVAKITGDTTGLEEALQKANGEMRRLEKDEVIIKLNYDGNVKGFNEEFAKMQKQCPELTIQFQYNTNQKMLNKEADKLKQLQQLKLDVETGGADKKIASMISDLGSAVKNDVGEDVIKSKIRYIYKYANTIKELGGQISQIPEFGIYKAVSGSKYEQTVTKMMENVNFNNLKLFKFSGTIDEEIKKTEDRISDFKDFLSLLESKGASKSGLSSELEDVQEEIKMLRSDIEEMQSQLNNLSGQKFEDMAEQVRNLRDALSEVLTKLGVISTSAFKDIIPLLNSLGKPKGGKEAEYYEKIGKIFDSLDDKTKNLLKDLGLLNSQGGITPIIDGANNYGGLIGEENTAIVRQGTDIENAKKLKQALDEAYEAGVRCSRIIDIVETADGKVIELQNTVKGNPLQDSDFNFDINGIKASDEQIQKLYNDVKKLWELGIAADLENPSNLIFDESNGFQIIDLDFIDHAELQFNSFEELWESFVENIKANVEDLKNVGDSDTISQFDEFVNKIAQASKTVAEEATRKAADAIKETQDSNSPAELTKPLGKDFGDGYAEGIREAMPEIIAACKEIVLAAYNAISELNKTSEIDNTNIADGFVNGFKESLEKQRPVLQEKIKEIFSKFDLGEENSSLFTGMGQRIIDSIIAGIQDVHSSDNFADALLKVVNNAFENIMLGSAVDSLINRIYQKMGEALDNHTFNVVNFDVKTDTLVTSIQNGLNTHTFNVNLGGTVKELATAINTSADNVRMSFVDIVKWIREANELQKVNRDATHERQLFYNSKTGDFSNPAVVGDSDRVHRKLMDSLLKKELSKGKVFDTNMHWHEDWNYSAPSSQDLVTEFAKAYIDGIDKFVVGAQKDLTEIDFSVIAKNRDDLVNKIKEFVKNNIKDIVGHFNDYASFENKHIVVTNNPVDFINQIDSLDSDKITRFYGEYVGSMLDLEWERLKDSFRKEVESQKKNNYKNTYDFSKLKDSKASIGLKITTKDVLPDIKDVADTLPTSERISDNILSWAKSYISSFQHALAENIKNGIENNGFQNKESIVGIVNDTLNNLTLKGSGFDKLKNHSSFPKLKESIANYFSDWLNNMFSEISTSLTWRESNDAYQQAGRQALNNISEKTLLKGSVTSYTHSEFENKYGGKLPKTISQKQTESSTSPTLPSDFQQQLQNAINETGEYVIKICGELVADFKSRLQTAIDKTGEYHVNVEGSPVNVFHEGLQSKIDEGENYIVKIKGELIKTFKEVLQNAINGLGAFPIEVKPYMGKGVGITEGDGQAGFVTGENAGDGVVGGFREAIDAHSNSKEAERATDDFANGVVDELEARTPDMVNAAEKAADSVSDAFNDALNGVENTDNLNIDAEFRELPSQLEKEAEIKRDDTVATNELVEAERRLREEASKPISKTNNVESENTSLGDNTESSLLSKKKVIEQLRSELQLTQKAAEELFNQQGYDKINGKYQIEQQAVDELIASLKEKKEVEESTESSPNFESAITEYITDLEKTEVQADKTRQAIQNICDINTADSSVDFLARELHNAEVEAKKLSSETVFKNKISKQAVNLDNQKIKTKDGTKYSEELTKRITDANKQIEELRNKLSSVSNDDQLKEWISEFDVLKATIKGVNDAIREENSASKPASSTQSKSNQAKSQYIKLLKEENELRLKNYIAKRNGESDENFDENIADIERRKQATLELINVEEREEFVIEKNAEYKKKYNEAIIRTDQQVIKEEEAIQRKRISLAQQITQWLKANPVAEKKYGSMLNESIAQLNSSAKLTPEILKQIEQEFKNVKLQATSAGETGTNFFTMLKNRWMALGTYIGSFTSFYRIVGTIRQAFSTITELDTQLVDLRKTTKMNNDELEEFYKNSNDIAKQMGVTTSEIISQAAAWSRLNKIGLLYGNI